MGCKPIALVFQQKAKLGLGNCVLWCIKSEKLNLGV